MTAQSPDTIAYKGRNFTLLNLPMGPYFATLPLEQRMFDRESTANQRGYAARWEVAESRLYLTSFWARIGGRAIGLEHYFGPGKRRAEATWVTGDLHLGDGEARRYAFSPADGFSHLLILTVREGFFEGERREANPRWRPPSPAPDPNSPVDPKYLAHRFRYLARLCELREPSLELDREIAVAVSGVRERPRSTPVPLYTSDRAAALSLYADPVDEPPAAILEICADALRQRANLADKGVVRLPTA
jgi:hypothetical protein